MRCIVTVSFEPISARPAYTERDQTFNPFTGFDNLDNPAMSDMRFDEVRPRPVVPHAGDTAADDAGPGPLPPTATPDTRPTADAAGTTAPGSDADTSSQTSEARPRNNSGSARPAWLASPPLQLPDTLRVGDAISWFCRSVRESTLRTESRSFA